jgi:hypothetical protein
MAGFFSAVYPLRLAYSPPPVSRRSSRASGRMAGHLAAPRNLLDNFAAAKLANQRHVSVLAHPVEQ